MQLKTENLEEPRGCCFSHLHKLLDIASWSTGRRYNNWSLTEESNMGVFVWNTPQPFVNSLIEKIEVTIKIPENMKGFKIINASTFPDSAD